MTEIVNQQQLHRATSHAVNVLEAIAIYTERNPEYSVKIKLEPGDGYGAGQSILLVLELIKSGASICKVSTIIGLENIFLQEREILHMLDAARGHFSPHLRLINSEGTTYKTIFPGADDV